MKIFNDFSVRDLYEGAYYLLMGAQYKDGAAIGRKVLNMRFDAVKVEWINRWRSGKATVRATEYAKARLRLKMMMKPGNTVLP